MEIQLGTVCHLRKYTLCKELYLDGEDNSGRYGWLGRLETVVCISSPGHRDKISPQEKNGVSHRLPGFPFARCRRRDREAIHSMPWARWRSSRGNSGGAAPCPSLNLMFFREFLGFIFRHWREDFYKTVFFFSLPCLLLGKHFLIFHVETARLVLVGGTICFLIDESPKVTWGIRILSPWLAVHEANGTSDLHDIDCAFGCARSTYVGRGFPCPISRGSVHGNCP